jgi:hypothetical protein
MENRAIARSLRGTLSRSLLAVGVIGLLATTGLSSTAGALSSQRVLPASNVASHAVKAKIVHVAFKGSYTGTIGLLWSSTGVQATSVKGTGTGTDGANVVSGSGSGSAASTCDPFSGLGALSGASGLKLRVASSSKTQACAVNSAAPTPVTVKGVATVLSGTGKFKGATGTLSFSGSFSIQATTAGSSESDSFSATLTGTLTIK